MACKTCASGKNKMGVCDVHSLVDNDERERLVKWCELCKAYICDQCRGDLIKRAKAAAIKLMK